MIMNYDDFTYFPLNLLHLKHKRLKLRQGAVFAVCGGLGLHTLDEAK